MRARRRSAAKAGQPRKAASPVPPPQPDLQALNQGLFGLEGAGREAGAAAEGSVQDPLRDWPEAEGEPDRWLLEREAQQGEQEER
ncbi:MAG: hypothetical protein HYY78_13495 [Betaproteobacteria bacterium]|nr:hypothetical protein [Betaproteobacteria bacterium]